MYFKTYAVLISIFPLYANQIFEGKKLIEFRRRIFKSDVKKIVVYSTSPIGRIVGCWDFDGFDFGSPMQIWKKYSEVGGIKIEDFKKYFKNIDKAYGIKVKNPFRFKKNLSIEEIGKKPPQSYVYLSESEFQRLYEKANF